MTISSKYARSPLPLRASAYTGVAISGVLSYEMFLYTVGETIGRPHNKNNRLLAYKLVFYCKKSQACLVNFYKNFQNRLLLLNNCHPNGVFCYNIVKEYIGFTRKNAFSKGVTAPQLYKNHYFAANAAVPEKHCETEDVLFVGSYVSLNELIEADNDDRNKNSRADYVRDTLGYSGQGVKIGQIEPAVPDVYNTDLGLLDIYINTEFGGANNDEYYVNHATKVAAVMVGSYGVAPSATLYSVSSNNLAALYPAIEWLVSQCVHVINMSSTTPGYHGYDGVCAYMDHLAVQHDVHFVVSAGNIGNGDDFSNYITSPAMAFNAITVGSYDDMGTVPENDSQIYNTQKDDVLAGDSRFGDNDPNFELPIGANKPNLVAMGTNVMGASGTSFAAPQVTGVIAQLCSYVPSLKTKQTSMGAILMASCGRKLAFEVQNGTEIISSGSFKGGDFTAAASISGTDNQISDKQGAGKLDAYWAYTIVRNGQYWSLALNSSVTTYTKDVYITKDSNTLTRVAIFWLKKNYADENESLGPLSGPPITRLELPDWDLSISAPNGGSIAWSVSSCNNYEVVQFVPPVSGIYTIELLRYTPNYTETSNIGLAVW